MKRTPSGSRGRRVYVVNAWHDTNAGDSAITDVCISVAQRRWPDHQIVVQTVLGRRDPEFLDWHRHLSVAHPDVLYEEAFFPEPKSMGRLGTVRLALRVLSDIRLLMQWMPMRERRRASAGLRAADHVVVVGGSDLFELRNPWLTGKLRLRRLTETCMIAGRMGVPYSFWGHTFGPFETGAARRRMARCLRGADDVVVRESHSLDLAQEIAPGAMARLLPDFAFGLDAYSDELDERSDDGASDHEATDGDTFAVFVPRLQIVRPDARSSQRLVHEFVTLASDLLHRGIVDRVVVVPQVIGPSVAENDTAVCARIVTLADEPRVQLGMGGASPRQLRDVYGRAEFSVAVRLHGAILSIAAGTPAFAISYFTTKTRGVMEDLGMGDSWCDFEDFDAARVREWLDLVALAERRRAAVRSALRARARLQEFFEESARG